MRETKKLFEEYGKQQHDLTYTGVFQIGADTLGHAADKVQIRIRRNSYDFQSYAVVESLVGKHWERLADIHWSNMTPSNLYTRDDGEQWHKAVATDSAILLERATKILS